MHGNRGLGKQSRSKRDTHIQVNLSELSVRNPRRSTVSLQYNPSSTKSSSRSSRFVAAVKQSAASIAEGLRRVVLTRDDDGCTLAGCQSFIRANVFSLYTAGFFLVLAWMDLNYSTITGRKYFEKEFIPNWPVWKKPKYFAICWIQTFVCGTWMLIGTFAQGKVLMRAYCVIVPWLLLIPISFCFFYVFYIGRISVTHTEHVLLDKLVDIVSPADLGIWDEMQSRFQCCGVKGVGWEEWRDYAVLKDVFLNDIIVPLSCCRKKDDNLCQIYPNNMKTYKNTCSTFVTTNYKQLGSLVISVLLISTIITCYSIFSALRFYWFLIHETNKKAHSKASQCCLECLCPCLIFRKTVPVSPEQSQSQLQSSYATHTIKPPREKSKVKLAVLHERKNLDQSSEEEIAPLSLQASAEIVHAK